MSFIASTLTLQNGFSQLLSIAQQEKIYLTNWSTRLQSIITALDAVEIVSNINRALAAMDSYAALPGMAAYAQAQFGGASYDVVAEYNTMRAAIDAVRVWLKANIPSNSITISDGVQVGQTFAPAVTAPLKSLVDAASATIS